MNNYQMLIKSMTIEKVAELLTFNEIQFDEEDDTYYYYIYKNDCGKFQSKTDAIKAEIEWLLEEAK